VTLADLNAGSITNKATASADGTTSNEDEVTVDAIQRPAIDVTKEVSDNGVDFVDANSAAAAPIVASGTSVTYRFTVENTGNVTLTNVTLSDSLYTFSGAECSNFPVASLAPGADASCTISRTITTALVENKATATGTPPAGPNVTDDDKAFVKARFDLTVSKTATGTFKRTYHWKIDKTTTATGTIFGQGGTTTPVGYSIKLDQDGFTDSDWEVTGTITVTNPNDVAFTGVDVTDSIPGATCTITGGGTNLTVPASGTKDVAYECTFASKPASYTGTNTATATWNKAMYTTPSGSAEGTNGFTLTKGATVNASVTVKDVMPGFTDQNFGPLAASDTTNATATYTYTRNLPVPNNACADYTNTATINQTGQSDTVTVRVCGTRLTGAKTIGFWQNKNGQAIIGSFSGTNCQALKTWLTQFNPFKDLTAANCAGVKNYVTNVIKNASASGASMNAMLKAQMLASALDVYFSDPALGGNRIGAPAPIGGVVVDLTKICKFSIGGVCSGAYQNASAAFGGATQLTVMQMLTYAASQSTSGGSTWYAQVKATQELAKNAFDAINNEWTFTP
jgi:hypothetical protein